MACHVTLRLGVIHAMEELYHASIARSVTCMGRLVSRLEFFTISLFDLTATISSSQPNFRWIPTAHLMLPLRRYRGELAIRRVHRATNLYSVDPRGSQP